MSNMSTMAKVLRGMSLIGPLVAYAVRQPGCAQTMCCCVADAAGPGVQRLAEKATIGLAGLHGRMIALLPLVTVHQC